MSTVYVRVITAGSVGGFDWYTTSEDRAVASAASDAECSANLDITLPTYLDPHTDRAAVTDFLDHPDRLDDMETAGMTGRTAIDFGSR